MKLEALAKKLATDVGAVLKKQLGDMRTEFEKKLTDAIAALPAPLPGEKGDRGDDGTVDMEAVKQILTDAVAALEVPKGDKGDKGDDGVVDMEALKQLIIDAVASVEIPKGEKGDPGTVDMEALEAMISQSIKTAVDEAVAKIELPAPEKGDPGEKGDKGDKGDAAVIPIEEVKRMIAEAVKAIELPEPKSAVDLEIEDGIDVEKVYPRGSYARHKGGLWRSFERTKGMKGWECIVSGIAKIEVDYDGRRTATITVSRSDGEDEVKTLKIPALLDADVWREQDYEKGDVVTFSGAMWIAQKDNPKGRPGATEDWRLSVKRGGTGKSAFDLAREAGFTGTRQEWLDQIGKKPTVKVDP